MNGHPREHLGPYLDGELSPVEAEAVERHLHGCTECARELALIRELGGAMRRMSPETNPERVWSGVQRRITRPLGWLLLGAGVATWAGLAVTAWFRSELTLEWFAGTGVGVGLFLLLIAVAHEQYRDWKDTRYKDVER